MIWKLGQLWDRHIAIDNLVRGARCNPDLRARRRRRLVGAPRSIDGRIAHGPVGGERAVDSVVL